MQIPLSRYAAAYSAAVAVILIASAPGCSATPAAHREIFYARLDACPDAPNCVLSTSDNERHAIEPILLVSDDPRNWEAAVEYIRESPRVVIVFESDYYLLAEYRSRIFAFVDDLELLLGEDARTVHVRSASQLGYYDWGVNRARVESLREGLQNKGIAQ